MNKYNYTYAKKRLLHRYKTADCMFLYELYDSYSDKKEQIYQQLYNQVSHDMRETIRIWGGNWKFAFGYIDDLNILHIHTYVREYTYEPHEYKV